VESKQQQKKLIDMEKRLVVPRDGREVGKEWVKWVKGVKRHKLPLIK